MKNSYKCQKEVSIRNFIKGMLTSPPMFNLPPNEFYSNVTLLDYIRGYDPLFRMSEERLTKYKNRRVKLGKIQKTKVSEEFIQYVKQRFPTFDESSFYLSGYNKSK